MILSVFRRREPYWSGVVLHVQLFIYVEEFSSQGGRGVANRFCRGGLVRQGDGVLQGDPLSPMYNVEGCCKARGLGCCKAIL